MPRKYQNPKLQIRRDVERPFYFIRYSAKGRRRVQLIGFVDDMTAKEANKRRAAFLEVINAGRLLLQADLKFRQVCEQFLAVRVPQLAFATQNNYRSYIATHVLPAFGAMKLCDIDGSVVEQWLNDKRDAGLGWWTRIALKGVLSAIFTAAKQWKMWEGGNPTEGVRIGRKKLVREKRLLSVEELRLLLAALPARGVPPGSEAAEALLSRFRMARLPPAEYHLAAADWRRNAIRGAARGAARQPGYDVSVHLGGCRARDGATASDVR